MPLTDTAIRVLKPLAKPQKLFDGNGLFLFVAPSGPKICRVKYHFQDREKLLWIVMYLCIVVKIKTTRYAGGFDCLLKMNRSIL